MAIDHNSTLQQIFDFVVEKLNEQGTGSVEVDSHREGLFRCLYRGPNGTRCAAGWLIPDELYAPEFEHRGFSRLQFFNEGPIADWAKRFSNDQVELICDLQSAHDNSTTDALQTGRDFVTTFNNKLPAIIQKHNLQ